MALAPLSEGDPLEVIDPDALAEAFIACRLPKSRWTHQAHLAVGLWHVSRFGRAAALPRLRTGIRRLNDTHRTVNSATVLKSSPRRGTSVRKLTMSGPPIADIPRPVFSTQGTTDP